MLIRVETEKTLQQLLKQEDTDNNGRITTEDNGPKHFKLRSIQGDSFEAHGTYYLSNLLQELILEKEKGKEPADLFTEKIFEKPVDRLSRMIRDYFWDGLTRRMDRDNLVKLLSDKKAIQNKNYIYVPFHDTQALHYYQNLAKDLGMDIQVVRLPEKITPEYVFSINDKPGILSLALRNDKNGQPEALPFVVPGGRFNEMYGWDSYFEALGLLEDGFVQLARDMVDNFIYQVKNYGQILNANRSYYLTRSQPPFLSSFVKAVFEKLPETKENKIWLQTCLQTIIHEYQTVWMSKPRLTETGLSRFYGSGIGLPSETEETQFDALLLPFAQKVGMDVRTYHQKYLKREIIEPVIEEYIRHDRGVRESGHDTSNRLDGICAHVNTVDLNSLLYKYETDIAEIIRDHFDDAFILEDGKASSSGEWLKKAHKRKELINTLMWDENSGFYFDYNFITKKKTMFESATGLYPLWTGIASTKQVEIILKKALPVLECPGGIAGCSKKSRGPVDDLHPQRQWDFPNGWAPHQIMIWEGLRNYGYPKVSERLAYRWLYTILKNAVDYNGMVPEKYDVMERTHKVFAEYGNVGTEFRYITREGFGWVNASFQIGKKYLGIEKIDSLNSLIPPEWLFNSEFDLDK